MAASGIPDKPTESIVLKRKVILWGNIPIGWHPMNKEENAFINAFKDKPLDEVGRGAYADWLDEHGRHEEAEQQRKWIKSILHLAPYYDYYAYYPDEESGVGIKILSTKQVWEMVEYWKGGNNGNGFDMDEPYFNSTWAQDELRDHYSREKFWDAFEVITGKRPKEEVRHCNFYRCPC